MLLQSIIEFLLFFRQELCMKILILLNYPLLTINVYYYFGSLVRFYQMYLALSNNLMSISYQEQLQPMPYKRFFRCNNYFLLLVYTITGNRVDPPPIETVYMKHALPDFEDSGKMAARFLTHVPVPWKKANIVYIYYSICEQCNAMQCNALCLGTMECNAMQCNALCLGI